MIAIGEVRMDLKPAKQRARKSLTCLPCRKRKVKCDFGLPCGQCKLRGKSELCAYGEHNRWGYSKPLETTDLLPGLSLASTLKQLKESNALLGRDLRNHLFTIFKEQCHPFIPILDLDHMARVSLTFDGLAVPNLDDFICILVIFSMASRSTTITAPIVPNQVVSKLEETARELIDLSKAFEIKSIRRFKTVFLYACFLYWVETPFHSEAYPLFGLLQGSLRGQFLLRNDKCLNDLFGLVEHTVALTLGLPAMTVIHPVFGREDLFLKCRHTLMKYKERIFTDVIAKGYEVPSSVVTELGNEIIKGVGIFSLFTLSLLGMENPVPLPTDYELQLVKSLGNHLGLLLYRPFLVPSSAGVEDNLLRQKALAAAIALIETALELPELSVQFGFFAFNDLYFGAFQAAILLAQDHFTRKKLDITPDFPESYRQFSIRIPPRVSPLSQELWTTKNENWRLDLAERCQQMFEGKQSHITCRAGRAALVLRAFLTGTYHVNIPELFGPFNAFSPDETFGSVTATFDPLYFTSFMHLKNSTEYEQRCHQAVYGPTVKISSINGI